MATKKKKRKSKRKSKPKKVREFKPIPTGILSLSEREQIIFSMLSRNRIAPAEAILTELKNNNVKIEAQRGTHSLGVLMKYLTAKACQDGYIITMVGGGRGAGNKASYKMEKRF